MPQQVKSRERVRAHGEVFTNPREVNAMLDMVKQETDRIDSRFLAPACKSGVFPREIAKRLIAGLESEIPDLEERLDHIYKNQLYGIAITELTSLLSRRSLYCSKWPNSTYSVVRFDNPKGNIEYVKMEHTWKNGRCRFCGAAEREYNREEGLEQYAYEFIHLDNPEEVFPMKFDVIIGNPPYQMSDGGNNASAIPIYQKFVHQAKVLNPRFLIMITPSRWVSGGKGLDAFRKEMLNDRHIRKMIDYINAKDCFPQNSVGGGVNYFLWERDYQGDCEITTALGSQKDTRTRPLNEFPTFVRHNKAVSVVHKVLKDKPRTVDSMVSSRNPFGLPTSERGHEKKQQGDLVLISSKGRSFISRSEVEANNTIDSYKVLISRVTYEHAGEPDKEGMLRVLSKIELLEPGEVCTDSYLIVGPFEHRREAELMILYLKSRFARFLISQTLSSINLSKDKFCFVPIIDQCEDLSDENLCARFCLNEDESAYLFSLIRPMSLDGDSNA